MHRSRSSVSSFGLLVRPQALSRLVRRALALLAMATCVLVARPAAAKPAKLAVTQIDGDDSGELREAVVEALDGKDLTLTSIKAVNRAVDKIGDIGDFQDRELKRLVSDLDVDAVLLGKLEAGTKLRFRMFVHKKSAGRFAITFKDTRSNAFRNKLRSTVVAKLTKAMGADGGDGEEAAEEPAEEPKPKKGKKGAAAAAAEEPPAEEPKPKKVDRVAEEAAAESPPAGEDAAAAKGREPEGDEPARKPKKKVAAAEDGGEVEGGAAPEPARAAAGPGIRFAAGASFLSRKLTFNNGKTFDGAPQGSSLPIVPGARIDAEVYPLALSGSEGALAGLGLAVEYDRALGGKLSPGGTAIKVTQSHLLVGARYRIPLGSGSPATTVTIGVDYGKSEFSPQTGGLADADRTLLARDAPAISYSLLAPGVALRLPVTRAIALDAGGQFLVVTDAGPIGKLASYGRAKVFGFDAHAGLEVGIGSHLAVRVVGELIQYGYTFTGAGMLSTGLDGDPATQDVGGLADRALGGSATLAVVY